MKISIENIPLSSEEQIVIRCWEANEQIKGIVRYVKSNEQVLLGYDNKKMTSLNLLDIFFIESVDDKVFAYTKSKVYELKYKLYKFETEYQSFKFVRCSKSVIVNLMKIDHVKPLFNGRLTATLFNREDIIISRQYVPLLKKCLSGGSHETK
ncbi:MAG: LytTR family DNA-binding domain-containing protein [Lachnospiraceae bacterium]